MSIFKSSSDFIKKCDIVRSASPFCLTFAPFNLENEILNNSKSSKIGPPDLASSKNFALELVRVNWCWSRDLCVWRIDSQPRLPELS